MKVFKDKTQFLRYVFTSYACFSFFHFVASKKEGTYTSEIVREMKTKPAQANEYIRYLEKAGLLNSKEVKGIRSRRKIYSINWKGVVELWRVLWESQLDLLKESAYDGYYVNLQAAEEQVNLLSKNPVFQEVLRVYVENFRYVWPKNAQESSLGPFFVEEFAGALYFLCSEHGRTVGFLHKDKRELKDKATIRKVYSQLETFFDIIEPIVFLEEKELGASLGLLFFFK